MMPQALELNNEGFIIRGVPSASQEEIDANPLWVNGPADGGFYRPRWDFANEVWFEGDPDAPTKRLEKTVAAKIGELRAACQSAIHAGFNSDALGTTHTYPCKQGNGYFDQSNLSASVTESMLPGQPVDWSKKFWCADASGVWEMRPHSAAQLQQVGQAGSVHVSTNIERCDQKVREVDALVARTKLTADDPDYLTVDQAITEVEAVAW